MKISCTYNYKGSSNIYLYMRQVAGDEIQLSTDYGEVIKDVSTTTELAKVIDDLKNGKYT